jgi:hypothetical protein
MKHTTYICEQSHDGPGCMFCDGGLFLCSVCDSFEGATTSDCPATKMTQEQIDAVYAGTLNFRNGQWLREPSGSCSSHYEVVNGNAQLRAIP